ncbi:MAG TPA: hypothetical protein PK453_12845 [Leptospiraceae bacterium]|nr:hypothetical protein [Leptospiraceae bacterium]HMY66613.1 hypothetical protein [Leptospiraceae bacterium]HNF14552.1 hypothetical protein [Leptospiraceae bacterium]HNF27210.1 hypothetical protein [Leptospiraceae bacterium]HNH07917.1 hypothetical protein [Leptospiraceae bacterium]
MKKLKIYLPVLFLLLVSGAVLYALNLFADMLIHPYWHVPGLTASCSDEQKESSPELCDGRALETVKKKYGDSVEEISLPMEGSGKIQGWHFPLKNADSAVIFVHGAGGDRRNGYRYLPFFSSAGYSYISYDSPNHGISSNDGRGVSYGEREKKAFAQVVRFAESKYKNIFVFASSAGCSSVLLSQNEWKGKVNAVIFENPYYSLRRLVEDNPTAKALPGFFLNLALWNAGRKGGFSVDDIRNADLLEGFPDIPVLVAHGTADAVIPFGHGMDFYGKLKVQNKKFLKGEGAGHSRVWNRIGKEFEKEVLETFKKGEKK